MSKKYSTFCIMPFSHLSTMNDGTFRVCCHSFEPIVDHTGKRCNTRTHDATDVWNNSSYTTIRQKLANSEWPSACTHCKEQEEAGAYSPRQHNNDQFENLHPPYEKLIKEAIEQQGVISALPIDLELRVGTLCNLKCIMCYAGASSLHQEEIDQWKKDDVQLPAVAKKWEDTIVKLNLVSEEFSSIIVDADTTMGNLQSTLPNIQFMTIVGGEPLINPLTPAILETCVSKGYAKNINLSIITNLSAVNRRVIQHLNEFNRPTLYISYDHIDPQKFNFIRFPASYETFCKNLNTVFEYKNIVKKLSTTWSIFNIFDLPEIFEHWNTLRLKYDEPIQIQINIVNDPSYFSIKYLTGMQKQILGERLTSFIATSQLQILNDSPNILQQLESLVSYLTSEPEDYIEVVTERARVLALYDKTRGTNYRRLFPTILNTGPSLISTVPESIKVFPYVR